MVYSPTVRIRDLLIGSVILSLALCVTAWLNIDAVRNPFVSDAGDYALMAQNLLKHHIFSLDGITPTIEREPGMSAWLAIVFFFFGTHALTLYIAQGILFMASTWFFTRQCEPIIGILPSRAVWYALCIIPTAHKIILSAHRELLAYAVLTIILGLALRQLRHSNVRAAIATGLLSGLLTLIYFSFVILPLSLAVWFLMQRKYVAAFALVLCLLFPGAWMTRNATQGFGWSIVGSARTTLAQYFRGTAARDVAGVAGPWRCLWAEYITRNYENVPISCYINGVLHTTWPEGFDTIDPEYAAQGRALIREHVLAYAWFSVAEIAEFHVPFVGGGWHRAHNVWLTAWWAVILAGLAGVPLAYRTQRNRAFLQLLLLVVSPVIFGFALTDATPRYLTPLLSLYAALSIVGYTSVISWLRTASSFRRSTKNVG